MVQHDRLVEGRTSCLWNNEMQRPRIFKSYHDFLILKIKNGTYLYGSGHWDRTLICCRESGHAPGSGELHKIHRPTWPGNEWPYCPSRKFDSKGCAGHSSFRPGNRPPKDGARWPPNTGPSKNNRFKAIQNQKSTLNLNFEIYYLPLVCCSLHKTLSPAADDFWDVPAGRRDLRFCKPD